MIVRYDIIDRKLFMSFFIDQAKKMEDTNAECIVRWGKIPYQNPAL